MKFEELPLEFPCEQLYWEAPTVFAWASCPYQSPPRGVPTMPTLRALLNKETDIASSLKPLDDLSKRLLTRSLGRCLESIQVQMESGVYNVLWEDSSGRAVTTATRARISRSIMLVCDHTWKNVSQGSNLRSALRIAIATHYSHIYAAGRLTGIITRIARRRAAEADSSFGGNHYNLPNTTEGVTRENAHEDVFIKTAFQEDPRNIRELMWHSTQVIFLQRRHPFNSPHEPLSVFLAGISLWAFLKYFNPEGCQPEADISVQLDEPYFGTQQDVQYALQEWIDKGGKTYLDGIGNVRSSDAPRRMLELCIDMTKRLKVWKMALKVSEIFSRLLQREDQERDGESTAMTMYTS